MTKSGILNIGDWIIVPEDNTIFITVIAGYDLYYLYTTGGIDGGFTQRNAGNKFINYNSITYENSTYIFTCQKDNAQYELYASYGSSPTSLATPQELTGATDIQSANTPIYYNNIRNKYYFVITNTRYNPNNVIVYESDTINGTYTLAKSYLGKNNGSFYFNNCLYLMYANFIYKLDKTNYDLISCFCNENTGGFRTLSVCQDCVLFIVSNISELSYIYNSYEVYQFRNDKIVNKLNMPLDMTVNLLYAYSNYFVYSLPDLVLNESTIYVNNYGTYYPWFDDKITYIKQS